MARFFRDLYDTADGADESDNVAWPPAHMLRVWESFPTGYGYRQATEPRSWSLAWVDSDGRNAIDYRKVECTRINDEVAATLGAIGHCGAKTEFTDNCLDGQDND